MWSARRIGLRGGVTAMSAVLVAAVLAAGARAEHSVLELVATGPAGGNGAFAPQFQATSPDGSRVIFTTSESLVSADTDAQDDVYERFNGQTTLLSVGPDGGNGAFPATFGGASADGLRVFFVTLESLVSGDTDGRVDVYERFNGQTTLLSVGPTGGNGPDHAFFRDASADGSRVFFATTEKLVSGDLDTSQDIYERFNGQTTLVSTGPIAGPSTFLFWLGASTDGTRAFFTTDEALVSGDTDSSFDVYERSAGMTTLMSIGPDGGNGAFGASFAALSADGTRLLFGTEESLVSGDTDSSADLYERFNGQTTLLSTGPAGGNGAFTQTFVDASEDGSRVFFVTSESLVSADTDSSADLYERTGTTTTLVSTGPAGGNGAFDVEVLIASEDRRQVSDDGSRVFFGTAEPLVTSDTDTSFDVYERSAGQTALVSTGPAGGNGAFDAFFHGASADGSRVFFATFEALATADTDASVDVYERSGGQTTLVSTGPSGGNGAFDAVVRFVSADGSRVFLTTDESLLGGDSDTSQDLYVSRIAPSPPNPADPPVAGGGGGGGGDVPAEVAPVFSGAVAAQVIEGDRDGDGIPDSQDTSDASGGPVLAESVVVQVVSGEVFVRRPGGSPRSAGRAAQVPPGTPAGFVPVKGAEVIPVGSVVHTMRGRVALTSAAQVVGGRTQRQRADFFEGVFQIRQARARRPVTELVLRGSYAQVCGSGARSARAGADPDAAASQRRSSRRVSRLWGDGRGRFRTKGRYSAASVRGTVWLTENRCDGTLTRVRQGRVTVRDFTARRTVTVRAGGSYLARAQRATTRRR